MYYRSFRFLQVIIALLTIISLNLSIVTSALVLAPKISGIYAAFYFKYWYLLNIWWFLFHYLNRVYNRMKSTSFDFFLRQRVTIYITAVIIAILYLFFLSEWVLLRFFIISTILCYGIGLLINHFVYLRFVNLHRTKHPTVKRVLILGYNNVAKKLARYFEEEQINYFIVGFSENHENIMELSHYPIVSDIEHTVEVSKKLAVNEIFLTITPEQNNELYNLIYEAENECIRILIVPDFSYFIQKPVHVRYFKDIPILSLRSEPLENIPHRFLKRFLDIVVSIIVITLVLSWLVPLLGLLICLESTGPVFFTQLRTGRNNRQFRCLKFRSMRINKDAHVQQASRNDNRITKIGRFIRKTSLDEFPQFFNVLKGDMSVVGPRPHMLKHTLDYSKSVNQFMIRQFLKPGITGWAQVNGFRGEISTKEQLEKRLEYDIWYLENWTFLLDLKIIFLTFFNILKGEENAF
jgi:putative colanic acid biosynthesis UDP-glucose lipid carrier transferase